MSSFYTPEELRKIPFRAIGVNVLLSRKASINSPENISINSNVRIDDFCILSGKIIIGNNVHIAAHSVLFGGIAGIKIEDFANISSRVAVYAVSDDYSGHTMTNPTIPDNFKQIQNEPVTIGKHVIIGTGSTILPGVFIAEGTALGAMSLCKKDTQPWKIYCGVPAKEIKNREKNLLKLEKEYLNEHY